MNPRTPAVALALIGALALTACSGAGAASTDSSGSVAIVGYSVLEEANQGVQKAFQQTEPGKGVVFTESYGASGDQSRAVAAGQRADEVHLSLEPDVTRLVDAGLVDADWKDNDTAGVCTDSVVVFVVRKGNPKNITTWADLIKPGVQIVTPDPASSGSAKWNLLAAYGSAAANGGDAAAQSYITSFFDNVIALPASGRQATSTFTGGKGDVLISYENEAILARQSGSDFDYVVPDSSLLIENSCALLKDHSDAAESWLAFQKSVDGQKEYAATGYRPLASVADQVGTLTVDGAMTPDDPFPTVDHLLTIDGDFGGWDAANKKFFDADNGILTKIQSEAGF
ncbi:sulfate ABC transporter substrate-binding protein [Microbacterium sp. KR10-403]|uniref:sulfate ABC transporter substrate-binding protein n=1 Tax=Microbacterium sp. KR10-403 TaxID=3158581 RepID=UPI0032E4AD54